MSQRDKHRNIPVVFISSTSEDLKAYREKAREAVDRAKFSPDMMEYFGPSGHPPLGECLRRVAKADLLVVIIAHRYGWVPKDQPTAERKSITWLECEQAWQRGAKEGKEVLAFLVDEKYPWPEELKEEYRLTTALREGKATSELLNTVQDNIARLSAFKAWLKENFVCEFFTTPEDLRGKVTEALLKRRIGPPPPPPPDPTRYLQDLRKQTSYIEIRGLKVGSGKAIRIPIERLYIPLTTTLAEETPDRKAGARVMATGPEPRAMPRIRLEKALKHRLLVIVGDPGSGKTTFLRHLALLICKRLLGEDESAGEKDLGAPVGKAFPMRIAIATLWRHMEEAHKRGSGPTTLESSGWLAHYLATQCGEAEIDLKEEFFRARLSSDSAIVLLDGLDEAPSDQDRRRMVKLIEDAARVYGKCRFVVTSRPAAYVGDALLPGFVQARIDDLEDEAIDLFLKRWCEELFPESPKVAEDHHAELLGALRRRPEIRRLARNPVMLTALAVVHWHEKRLPEQRADLYESILEWLAKSRPRPGRQSPERCIGLLQNLALAMQDHPKGRQVQVPRYWAAREIAPAWREAPEEDRAGLAEQFLKDEELDSGIVVGRGDDTRFWHLTFQEYLAGRALAARDERRQAFLSQAQLYQPEWREVILLLAGVLYHQGPERVDGMVTAILDRIDNRFDSKQLLGEQARSVGLLGAIVRDLAPVRYQPGDERYKQALDAVLAIFDKEKSRQVDFQIRLEAAEALGQAGDPRLGKDNWITIPAGKFWMGAQKEDPSKPNYDPRADKDESPVHEVYLKEYQIGRYPVTVEEYKRFVDDEGYNNGGWWKEGGFGEKRRPENWDDQVLHPNWPVVSVSWYEAAAYCAWAGVRLPTEAEWERAARGTNGRKYPWGNEELDATRANYGEKVGHPTPVGLYPRGATPEGIEDLAGNVWEWMSDRYEENYYRASPKLDPRGPNSGVDRVLRGGSWFYFPRYVRVSNRDSNYPAVRYYLNGFRCGGEVSAP